MGLRALQLDRARLAGAQVNFLDSAYAAQSRRFSPGNQRDPWIIRPIATGKVTDACYDRHTHVEFLDFLKLVATAYPRVRLHVVADNYATHKHPAVNAWLAKHPRVTMHVTPTSGSWLNMVEIFFGIITRQAIRRGSYTSTKDLIAAIEIFIDGWNERCQPLQPSDQLAHHLFVGITEEQA